MKKQLLRLLPLLLACAALLSACSGGSYDLHYADGAYSNSRREVSFRCAPACYRAVSAIRGETVAMIRSEVGENVPLYEIEGMDTALWLTDDSYVLYYEDKATLPTLRQLNPAYVALSYVSYPIEISRLENKNSVDGLITLYETTPAISGDRISSSLPDTRERFELLFFTNDRQHAGISYSLEYWKFDSPVLIYAKLNADGTAPDTCPGITPSIEEVSGETVAVFRLGTGLVYDRSAHSFYPFGSQLEAFFENT